MKTVCVFVVGAGLAILAGCRHAEPSPIVTAFQNAGGGDVGGIYLPWLRREPVDFAVF